MLLGNWMRRALPVRGASQRPVSYRTFRKLQPSGWETRRHGRAPAPGGSLRDEERWALLLRVQTDLISAARRCPADLSSA
jgi:hypothetical protein